MGVGCLQSQICQRRQPEEERTVIAASVAEPAALTNGYNLSFGIGAGLVLAALFIAAKVLRPAEEAKQEALRERDRPLVDAAFPSARVR